MGHKDEPEARQLFVLAAAQGNANAQYSLGLMHLEGRCAKDKTEAQRVFEAQRLLGLAAAQGNTDALWRLGCMRLHSAPQDEAEGLQLLRLAAVKGHVCAWDVLEQRANAMANALLAEEEEAKAKSKKKARDNLGPPRMRRWPRGPQTKPPICCSGLKDGV